MKKINKQICTVALAVTAMLTSCLTGCSQSSADSSPAADSAAAPDNSGGREAPAKTPGKNYPVMQIDMACNNANSPDESLLMKFAELVEERSGGAITAVDIIF